MAVGDTDHPVGIYQLKEEARKLSVKLPEDYMFVEIGTYQGGSATTIMEAIKESGKDRWFISIDPYGSIPYKSQYDGYRNGEQSGYHDGTYRETMAYLYGLAEKLGVKYAHYRMSSLDWIASRPPLYEDGKKLDYKFGFVYLDGAHVGTTVAKEFKYFSPRTKGTIIIDDWSWVLKDPAVQDVEGDFRSDDRLYWKSDAA